MHDTSRPERTGVSPKAGRFGKSDGSGAADALSRAAAAIHLCETPGLPDREVSAAIERHGGPAEALARSRVCAPARSRARARAAGVERRARSLLASGARLITVVDRDYPARLRPIDWRPPVLFVQGAVPPWPERVVTIVGTRKATPSALHMARTLAGELVSCGVAVCSGLALGIDGAAHEGALAWGGSTLAVVATGLDVVYPRAHRRLARAITRTGAVLSECSPGTQPRAFQFPRRNRILAALADCVVVVQAPEKSGALITVRHALDIGVEVLAVPGDPLLPECRGSNRLIADGARPVLGIEDVLSAVVGEAQPLPTAQPRLLPSSLGVLDRRLLQELDLVPRSTDALIRVLGASTAELLSRVAALELEGWVETLPGGRVRLTPAAAAADRWSRPEASE